MGKELYKTETLRAASLNSLFFTVCEQKVQLTEVNWLVLCPIQLQQSKYNRNHPHFKVNFIYKYNKTKYIKKWWKDKRRQVDGENTFNIIDSLEYNW